jgi:hypothetical protein
MHLPETGLKPPILNAARRLRKQDTLNSVNRILT